MQWQHKRQFSNSPNRRRACTHYRWNGKLEPDFRHGSMGQFHFTKVWRNHGSHRQWALINLNFGFILRFTGASGTTVTALASKLWNIPPKICRLDLRVCFPIPGLHPESRFSLCGERQFAATTCGALGIRGRGLKPTATIVGSLRDDLRSLTSDFCFLLFQFLPCFRRP